MDKVIRYDTADYPQTEEEIIDYLRAVMEESEGDPAFLLFALGAVTRNINVFGIEINITRED